MIIHTDSTFNTDRYICIGSNHWNSLRNKLSLYTLEFSINANDEEYINIQPHCM